ncbi:helix-turn-helix domain-containing protein [Aurantibacillus circumpalustris]|uniref:helix-turn-helix domain-containing protein n=1 Tax=Aurantibacillus circumpalustris TaxID=3036359 RepID=UPI00295BEBC1|nr:helix-turn-helix domain-containing protein [Aurantibacillus circumpalustris]
MSSIEINSQFEQVLNFVNRTNQLIFLTGKAGTGKTTLLKYIRENTFKQSSIVAPTGVAAINAGGSTIHSFFQFPFTPFLPTLKENGEIDSTKSLHALKYNSQRLAIFKNLELLVIDEISMVRADLLDQIDVTLRYVRKKSHLPFGGVQVLLIGDMYQLPPVVQQEEWKLLNHLYPSAYFFDSLVMRRNPPVYIELDKIYRQSEQTFIQLLNKVRNNNLDQETLELLNSHFKPTITQQDYQENITLTTHNRKADEINARNLKALQGKEYTFRSKVEGTFSDRNYPTDENLVLKKGTRVMFLKNNNEKNYYNGKIGIVSYIDSDKIKVKCSEDNYEIEVSKEVWTNVSYKVDKATKHIEEEVLGTYTQYPLRLAWAITIHKSQGLTFDKLIIDAAESFSAGQVYVALSRCRSLSGLTLSSKINPQSLLNDKNILNFASTKPTGEKVNTIFSSGQRDYIKIVLVSLFDFSEQIQNRQDLGGVLQMYSKRLNNDGLEWINALLMRIELLNDVANRFKHQLGNLIDKAGNIEVDQDLQSRLKQAAGYFEVEIKKCLDHFKNCSLVTESKEAATELNEILQLLFEALFQKYTLIKTIENGFVFSDFVKHKLNLVYPNFKISVYASAKNTKVSADIIHPKLYRELLLQRDEICNDEHKPIYMVASNKTLIELANYLPDTSESLLKISGFGDAKVNAYGDAFLGIIKAYMSEHEIETNIAALSPKKEHKTKKEKSEGTDKLKKISTKEQTYNLFKQGLKVEDIAKQRGFALSTIQGHLIPYIATGEVLIDDLVSKEKQNLIAKALEKFNYEEGLNPIKSNLPEEISFSEIRYVMAHRLKD